MSMSVCSWVLGGKDTMAFEQTLYPLRFKEILRDYGFGNRWIVEEFDKEGLPEDHRIAETWETVDRPTDSSEIINGPMAGKTLHDAIIEHGEALLGSDVVAQCGMRYPLLIKFLDASNVLGEQSHPTDEQAKMLLETQAERLGPARVGDTGKTEAWYMLRARPGASVHAGNKDGVTREVFEQALMDRSTIKCMVEHEVEAGDGFLLHAGMMHYSKGGVIFYEIMQNSDITIGLRGVPEDLPEEERRQRAKELTDLVHLEDGCNCKTTPRSIDLGDGNTHTFIFACRYFSLERFDLAKPMEMEVNGGRFCVLSQVYGQSDVIWGDSKETLRTGQSCLLPASLGSVRIEPGPDAALLRATLPDLKQDVIEPLRAAGYSDAEIAGLGGETELNDLVPLM